MDAQNGAGLQINGKGSTVVALGPNINVNLRLSPTQGGKFYNANMVNNVGLLIKGMLSLWM